jgi:hypothetical protein
MKGEGGGGSPTLVDEHGEWRTTAIFSGDLGPGSPGRLNDCQLPENHRNDVLDAWVR